MFRSFPSIDGAARSPHGCLLRSTLWTERSGQTTGKNGRRTPFALKPSIRLAAWKRKERERFLSRLLHWRSCCRSYTWAVILHCWQTAASSRRTQLAECTAFPIMKRKSLLLRSFTCQHIGSIDAFDQTIGDGTSRTRPFRFSSSERVVN